MAAVPPFRIHEVEMPARRIDAFDISGQPEADQIAANVVEFKNRLVFCGFRKADSVSLLPGDRRRRLRRHIVR